MSKKPNEIMKISKKGEDFTIYKYISESSTQKIKARLFGSVNRVIECDVRQSDLKIISNDLIESGTFGFGAAAIANKEAISSLGEAFGTNKRFFLANPFKVGPNDPYISVNEGICSPFFFNADLGFDQSIPKFRNKNSEPILEGNPGPGAVYKIEGSTSIQLATILEQIMPENLSAIYFRGKAYANDVVDKLLKLSPSIENKKPYGKINSPAGLVDFFVMNTIPAGFKGRLDMIAFGVGIKLSNDKGSLQKTTISEKILNKLFYFTPGTVKTTNYSSHMHGLIFSYDEIAPILPQNSINLDEIPLSEFKSGKDAVIPSSGRVKITNNKS